MSLHFACDASRHVGFEDPTAIDARATGREEWVEGTVDVPAPLPRLRVVGKLNEAYNEVAFKQMLV